MPSPALGSVQAAPWLNNVSIGYKNPGYQLQERIFPALQSAKTKGTYVIWTKGEAFADEAGVCRPGDAAPRGTRSFTTTTYELERIAYAEEMYDDIMDEAEPVVGDQVATTEMVTDKVLLAIERSIATILTTGAWTSSVAISAGSEFDSGGGGDPLGVFDTARLTIEGLIGRPPNAAAFGWRVGQVLRRHAAIRDYVKYASGTAPAIVNEQMLAEVLDIPNLVISTCKYNSAKKGLTAVLASIMSDYIWVGYVAPSPARNIPSAGYGFKMNVPPIKTYREEKYKRDVIEGESKYVAKLTAADAGYLISNALAAI